MDGWHTVHDAVKLQAFLFVRCIVLVLFGVSALGRLMHLRVCQRLVTHRRVDILMAGKALIPPRHADAIRFDSRADKPLFSLPIRDPKMQQNC